MNIAAVAGAAETTQAKASDNVFGSQFIGKDGFIKLMITQMQNQDPLEPMSNEDFAAQLAQFSSLEQMQNLNDGFTNMMDLNKVSTTASLIGKEVVYQNQETGADVTGKVDRVIIKSNGIYFKIDGQEVSSDIIREIGPETTTAQ
jgi:flagellar basal-body rod modification protein FlgD